MEVSESGFASYGMEEVLVEACTRMGFIQPTEIQKQILEHIKRRKHILALSRTGTGKTLAYSLPVLQHLLSEDRYFYCLVLLPTRELSQQVHLFLQELGKDIGLRTSLLIGGEDILLQGKSLAARPHIVIGTPGRVAYHMRNTKGFSLESLKYLILDECDRLLDGDFEGEVREVLEGSGNRKNILLFTATLTKRVDVLSREIMEKPIVIKSGDDREEKVPSALVQKYLFIPYKQKEAYLYCVVRGMGTEKILVFTGTCLGAEKMGRILSRMDVHAESIHGGKTQRARTQAIEDFRKGRANVLVATDVAARGIDVPGIKCVLNYDVPEYTKDYVHRVGRTARAGASGIAITLVSQYDVEDFQRIEHYVGEKMLEYEIDKGEVPEISEEIFEARREVEDEMKELQVAKKINEVRKKK
jgi:ATP-dependent RNA helicase DDX47/RRP3